MVIALFGVLITLLRSAHEPPSRVLVWCWEFVASGFVSIVGIVLGHQRTWGVQASYEIQTLNPEPYLEGPKRHDVLAPSFEARRRSPQTLGSTSFKTTGTL